MAGTEVRGSGEDETLKRAPAKSRPRTFPIARVVTQNWDDSSPEWAEACLLRAIGKLGDERVKFLITPGGFVQAESTMSWKGPAGWDSRASDLAVFTKSARSVVAETVTDKVLAAAKGCVDAISVGVDVCREDGGGALVELVAVVDVQYGKVRWTGKSYPVGWQEKRLVQVADLKSHCLKIAGERVLVFGCHDLNMFNPRGRANQRQGSPRQSRCKEMELVAKAFHPTIVLHHPHTTDTPRIWSHAWKRLTQELPSVGAWGSAIRYHNFDGPPRDELERVLSGTASTDPGPLDLLV